MGLQKATGLGEEQRDCAQQGTLGGRSDTVGSASRIDGPGCRVQRRLWVTGMEVEALRMPWSPKPNSPKPPWQCLGELVDVIRF